MQKWHEYDLGQHYPAEISAPNNKCTTLKCIPLRYTNRSMYFGTNYKMLPLLTANKVAKENCRSARTAWES